MRSSLLIGFDLQNMAVTTENSRYQLQGRGLVEDIDIVDDDAGGVGKVIFALNHGWS
ncbi:MAG: hypothetical protein V7739_21085 [Motiliproteus sp.]